MKCPGCGRNNSPHAMSCECGHEFTTPFAASLEVTLFNRHLAFLDRVADDIASRTGQKAGREKLVSAIIDALEESTSLVGRAELVGEVIRHLDRRR